MVSRTIQCIQINEGPHASTSYECTIMHSAFYRATSNHTTYLPLLPTFHGMESENPYAHIKEFEDVCNTFQEGGASINLMRLKLFPFTLKDKTKNWLNSLRPRTKENEKFYEYWERYMEVINACPHMALIHGYCFKRMDEPNKGEVGKMKSQPNALNAKTGMYT
ncbi:hypothetical protein CK203_007473 [Vitis vinifera]|uniref:Retrotransposon gag domain-containing protein n=1 Tax=Vitis vinifera TaxID=29760 RepID=A0A438G199_VITVI|nr:hypothetical protein CK203_007473 [Vitis vinifera]